MSIEGLKHPVNHPDRIIDCEFALEPAFQALAAEAISAGWTESDVAAAMLNLAVAHQKGIMAAFAIEADIRLARQMIQAMKGDQA